MEMITNIPSNVIITLLALITSFIVISPSFEYGGKRAGTLGFGFEISKDGLMIMWTDKLFRITHRFSGDVFMQGIRLMAIRVSHGPPPNYIWLIDVFGLDLGYAPMGRWIRTSNSRYCKYFFKAESTQVKILAYEQKNTTFKLPVEALISISQETWTKDGKEVKVHTISLALMGKAPFVCKDRYGLPLNVIAIDWPVPEGTIPDDHTQWTDEMALRIAESKPISIKIDPEVTRKDGSASYENVGYRILGFARTKGEKNT